MTALLSAACWYANVPGITSAVGALIQDRYGRVLLAQPVYKRAWVFIGGTVEADESPLTALRREIAEELGLPVRQRPSIGRLLVTDWVAPQPGWDRPMHHLVFDCGQLDHATTGLRPPPQELRAVRFLPPRAAVERMEPHEGQRLRMALFASAMATHFYLQNGEIPDPDRVERSDRCVPRPV